jgi:PTH1 family peptidyl-tRNA hydrolase
MEEVPAPTLVIPQLIVGLGNPEPKYDRTRHNIGFAAVDALADYWQVSLSANRKFQGEFGEGRGPKDKIRLLKPQTYMNNSGRSIRAVLDWYKLPPQSVLIVYDDLDLPLGRLRLRLSGSAGGHNGMKSAIAHIGTQDFPRLRIGIGRPKNAAVDSNDKKTIGYVLGKFSSEETELMDRVLKLAIEAIELSLRQGVEKSMSLYNSRMIEL